MGARAKARPVRYGSEAPRLFTPPLRELTEETSLGFHVIWFATEILGLALLPWQRWLFIHMLELREDGTLRFMTVVVLIARQNGKSTIGKILALYLMMVHAWPLVLGTAQDLTVAEELWEDCLSMLEDDPELADAVKKSSHTNGKKSFTLHNKTKYLVRSATRRAGRGLSGNLILLDELREHQNWLAWGAITKTTMAQMFSLVLCLSNAGDFTSVVLAHLRRIAHEALGDPDGIVDRRDSFIVDPVPSIDFGLEDDELDDLEGADEPFEIDEDGLALFEWSAAPHRSKWDRDGWAEANPSMGHFPGMERAIAAASRTDPDDVFNQEVLCRWPDSSAAGPFPPGAWEQGTNQLDDGELPEESRIVSKVVACLSTSQDRSRTHVVVAGYRADGFPQVEVATSRYGQEWVRDWLMDPRRRDQFLFVTGQSKGTTVSTLMKQLVKDPGFSIPVAPWQGEDLTLAFGEIYDLVRDVELFHNPQPVLDIAAETAVTRKLGGGVVVDLAGSELADASPLWGAIGAVYHLLHPMFAELGEPVMPQVLDEDSGGARGRGRGSGGSGESGIFDLGF